MENLFKTGDLVKIELFLTEDAKQVITDTMLGVFQGITFTKEFGTFYRFFKRETEYAFHTDIIYEITPLVFLPN